MQHAIQNFNIQSIILLTTIILLFAPLSEAAKDCYDCHKKQKLEYLSKKNIHDPVKTEDCESCHKRHGFAQRLVLVANDNELCFSCHLELKEKFSSGVVHASVEKGYCWDCHDPHASNKKSLLRPVPGGTDDPASCLTCHNSSLQPALQATHRHKPVIDLQCLSCHEPHNSPHVALLKRDGSTICLTCHEKDRDKMTKAHQTRHIDALSCLDCHSGHASNSKGLLSDKTHPPFASGDCETCHTLPDASGQVSFESGTDKNAVCAECHEEQTRAELWKVPHPAVSDDNCLDCHTPHSSRYGNLLTKKESKICEDCHTDILTDSELAKHQPVALGLCDKCHDVHGSDNPSLLKKVGPQLCLDCHTTFSANMDSSQTRHLAAAGDCLTCHDPHEGIGPAILKKPPEELCSECHTPDSKAFTAASSHQPYVTNNCATCHLPHFSNTPHLLRSTKTDLCLNCHFDIGATLTLAHPHEPATSDCLSCHSPHFSIEQNLLNETSSELCLSCHDGLDLGLNKHYVHSPVKARECTGCHNPHGSERPALLSSRVASTLIQGKILMKSRPLSDKQATLCYTCHEFFGEQIEKSAAHQPVKDGQCDACHESHSSDNPGFVKLSAPELCTQCHTVDSTLKAPHSGYDISQSNCLDCHNPHLSTRPKLVREMVHPPFAEESCDNCHEQAPDGSIELADDITELCSSCHDLVSKDLSLPTLHVPFGSGECTSCHRVHAADQPKLLKGNTGTLCFECHGQLHQVDAPKAVHPPFAEGKCLDCHVPHASKNAGLLSQPSDSLCFKCHEVLKNEMEKGQVHSPVKSGECNSCHLPHEGPLKALLVTDKKELCGDCHDLGGTQIMTAHRGFDISNADCQNCHAPHVGQKGQKGLLLPQSHEPFTQGECIKCHIGNNTVELVAKGKDLCFHCHEQAKSMMNKQVIHPALEDIKECTACHGTHVGFGRGLQRKQGVQQCLTCHNNKEFTGKVQHEPAFEDCTNCHDPHSSDYNNLLDTPDVMELCMTCHPDATKTHYHPMGKGVINPRTKTDLDCAGCHSPHSSNEAGLLVAERTRKLCNNCHGTARQ